MIFLLSAVSLCGARMASNPSQEPVIVLAGDNPMKLAPSDEEYIGKLFSQV